MYVVTQETDVLVAMVRSIVESAVDARGIPEEIAFPAGEATVRNVRLGSDEPASRVRMRARAYFDATVRRMAARSSSPEGARFRTKLIAVAIEQDLRQGGVNEGRIAQEVEEWLACEPA